MGQGQGFVIILCQACLQYLQPAVLDDEFEITTWVSSLHRARAGRHFTIHRTNDGVLLAQAYTLGVWVDLHTQQPLRIPQESLDDFAPNIASKD